MSGRPGTEQFLGEDLDVLAANSMTAGKTEFKNTNKYLNCSELMPVILTSNCHFEVEDRSGRGTECRA